MLPLLIKTCYPCVRYTLLSLYFLLGDSSKPKSWSKYAADNNTLKKNSAKDEKNVEIAINPPNEAEDKTNQLLQKVCGIYVPNMKHC